MGGIFSGDFAISIARGISLQMSLFASFSVNGFSEDFVLVQCNPKRQLCINNNEYQNPQAATELLVSVPTPTFHTTVPSVIYSSSALSYFAFWSLISCH